MESQLNYQRIESAIQYLAAHFKNQPNLDEVAQAVHLSPFHFQRIFTEWAGITPKKFLQYLTTEHLKTKLTETRNLLEAADAAGLSSQSRVYDLFVNLEAVTPQEYKTNGAGLQITYGFHETPFGECLLAVTERGVCGLQFVMENNRAEAVQWLHQQWSNAQLQENPRVTEPLARQIFYTREPAPLRVLVKGTHFQVKVWQALLQIPMGEVASYQILAKKMDQPKALQAVGSAVGANPIGYLIPCHRVIKNEGLVGQYHWGSARKQAMLGWEMAQAEQRGSNGKLQVVSEN
jgi:AraC family transcriptional regulator of adaptative response/methylated-DNA-[protein]-cysteine methyltransferase